MQNVNEKIHEEEEGLLEESDKYSFYNSYYYDNINSLFSLPYLISYLTTIFL